MFETDSKRLACLRTLTLFLQNEITVANGYKHDLNTVDDVVRIVRGRMLFDDNDPIPMVSILESPNPDRFPNRAGDQDSGEQDQRDLWTIYVQGWVDDDKLNPTDPAYELMADCKKALAKLVAVNTETGSPKYPDHYLLGGLIAGLKYEAGTVRPPDAPSSKAFFWMRVVLEFVENTNDPYDHG
jgi:hypothetical protein